jgi:hypothetical protein
LLHPSAKLESLRLTCGRTSSRLTSSDNPSAWSTAFEPNKRVLKGIPPGLPIASAIWPIAVSGNGCCAAIAFGPMVRVYDLDRIVCSSRRCSPTVFHIWPKSYLSNQLSYCFRTMAAASSSRP